MHPRSRKIEEVYTACSLGTLTSAELWDRFGLTRWVPDWVVSGDIGVRKPDPRAYAALVQAACAAPSAIHFFDDRTGNVEAARAAGLRGHHFSSWADVRTVVGSTHRLTLAEQRRIAQ